MGDEAAEQALQASASCCPAVVGAKAVAENTAVELALPASGGRETDTDIGRQRDRRRQMDIRTDGVDSMCLHVDLMFSIARRIGDCY